MPEAKTLTSNKSQNPKLKQYSVTMLTGLTLPSGHLPNESHSIYNARG